MKVKQVVEAQFGRFHIGWSDISFTDPQENKISIEITDDQLLQLSDQVAEKAAKIRKEREEAKEESYE